MGPKVQEATIMKRVMLATVLATAFAAGSVAAQQSAGGQATTGTTSLGTVRITRNVMADGKPLKSGTYQVRLTAEEAKPEVANTDAKLERWVEFTRGGKVMGREVVSIVPGDEISKVAEGRPPRPGSSRVELLKGNDYLRVWINRGGTHYLIHLPTGAASTE
jgi:hypothetical protein